MNITKFNLKIKKTYISVAKKCTKSKDVKELLQDLAVHFKTDKWPLRYEHCFDISKIKYREVFNALLEIKGYKIYYSSEHASMMIKKGKK